MEFLWKHRNGGLLAMKGIKNKNIRIIIFLSLIGLSFSLLFFNISKHPIQQWDELTNINVVHESLKNCHAESVECMTLNYHQEPFFEKPPLWYWGTELTTKILGENLLSYRVISALSGIGIVLLIFTIVKKEFGLYPGVFSSLALLATNHLFITNIEGYFSSHTLRSADLDALQFLFMIAALYFLQRIEKEHKRIEIIYAGMMTGLAVLTKGPYGFLPLLIWMFYKSIQILQKKTDLLEGIKQIGVVISAFLFTIAPWHIWMHVEYGEEFWNAYMGYHVIKRVAETIEEHHEPIWFYIQMFLDVKVFVLGLVTIAGIIFSFVKKQITKSFIIFAGVIGTILTLLIFTLVPTKLAWYLLYIYPFTAIVLGSMMKEVLKIKNKNIKAAAIAAALFLILLGLLKNTFWILSL